MGREGVVLPCFIRLLYRGVEKEEYGVISVA